MLLLFVIVLQLCKERNIVKKWTKIAQLIIDCAMQYYDYHDYQIHS